MSRGVTPAKPEPWRPVNACGGRPKVALSILADSRVNQLGATERATDRATTSHFRRAAYRRHCLAPDSSNPWNIAIRIRLKTSLSTPITRAGFPARIVPGDPVVCPRTPALPTTRMFAVSAHQARSRAERRLPRTPGRPPAASKARGWDTSWLPRCSAASAWFGITAWGLSVVHRPQRRASPGVFEPAKGRAAGLPLEDIPISGFSLCARLIQQCSSRPIVLPGHHWRLWDVQPGRAGDLAPSQSPGASLRILQVQQQTGGLPGPPFLGRYHKSSSVVR